VEEFKSKWFLGNDDREQTVFDVLGEEGNTELLVILQEFRPEELNNVFG
jgi:hypothetical protein